MRTTLVIDDDLLAIARDLADRGNSSIGRVISDLARQALKPNAKDVRHRNGVLLLPDREDAPPVTLELVNELRDDGA